MICMPRIYYIGLVIYILCTLLTDRILLAFIIDSPLLSMLTLLNNQFLCLSSLCFFSDIIFFVSVLFIPVCLPAAVS